MKAEKEFYAMLRTGPRLQQVPGGRVKVALGEALLKERFATAIGPKSFGGLMICGLYWGGDIGLDFRVEGVDYGWAPTFAHATNACEYQKRIINWFRCWGHSLGGERPSELDAAISQTNLFQSSSEDIEQHLVDPRRWLSALRDLTQCARDLDVSGVVITSTALVDGVRRNLNLNRNPGEDLLFDHTTRWTPVNSGALELKFARVNGIRLVNCVHPRYPVRYSDLARVADVMGDWIDGVLGDYRRKQLSRQVTARLPVQPPSAAVARVLHLLH